MKHWIFFLSLLVMTSTHLMADQAAYIEKETAERSLKALSIHHVLQSFCAPCDDENPTALNVRSLEVKHTGYQDYYEVVINGRGVDLAYLYFKSSQGWKNVALALNLPVSRVPTFIEAE